MKKNCYTCIYSRRAYLNGKYGITKLFACHFFPMIESKFLEDIERCEKYVEDEYK